MNRIWRILSIIALIFPFAALGYELAMSQPITTFLTYVAIVVFLVVTTFIASRYGKPTDDGDTTAQP
jgi:hypothetical protein